MIIGLWDGLLRRRTIRKPAGTPTATPTAMAGVRILPLIAHVTIGASGARRTTSWRAQGSLGLSGAGHCENNAGKQTN